MLEFRAAKKEDCRAIAELYSISSDGVADYIWTKLANEGEDILDVGQRRYEEEESVFSYKNCIIVEKDKNVIGMLVAFPMLSDGEISEDPVLAPYSALEADNSFYICGVALKPEYRGQGIGTELMRLAEQQAKIRKFNLLSLVVFEENQEALKLYRRLGYEEVKREKIVPHPLIHCSGDAILMIKKLS
ncbi:MAG: GNAT family N-acetyltransferase [Gammaproteobacteria bacterium]|nr:MAG: GNAT family N-acetyltransferase [Gammaproteobacteria bacterium]